MKRSVLLYVALLALTVSVMPNVIAVFAGQHSFYNDMGLNCVTCHSDIKNQLDLGNFVKLET